jgi:hypothetical protein
MSLKGRIKKTFLTKTPLETVKKAKPLFEGVSEIASSVNWSVRWAFYKPRQPTEEELRIFREHYERVKREFHFLKSRKLIRNPFLARSVEIKLKHMEEEFFNYPFSNRLNFFIARLNFLRETLRKCLYSDKKF